MSYAAHCGYIHRSIIIACGASKLHERDIAGRMYTGPVWQAWRDHCPPDGSLPAAMWLFALSAKHGLVPAWFQIEPYDHRLTRDDFPRLVELIGRQWAQHRGLIHHDFRKRTVAVIGGALYQDLAKEAGLPVGVEIDGSPGGIGVLRQRTAAFARDVHRTLSLRQRGAELWERWQVPHEVAHVQEVLL